MLSEILVARARTFPAVPKIIDAASVTIDAHLAVFAKETIENPTGTNL